MQPAFVNNPLSGWIILCGLFLPDWRIGVGCIVGGTIGTIVELVSIDYYIDYSGILKLFYKYHVWLMFEITPFQVFQIHPWALMRNGVAPFNAVLVGTVFSALFPVVFCMERTNILWIFIVIGSFVRYLLE